MDIIDYIKKKEITESSEYMEEIVDYIFYNYDYFVTDYKCYEIIDNNARVLIEMIEYVTEKYLEEGKTYIYGSIIELFNLFLYYINSLIMWNTNYFLSPILIFISIKIFTYFVIN